MLDTSNQPMLQTIPQRPKAGPASKIGKYEVIRKLGDGATSSVYLARDPFADREIAVKLVSQAALRDSDSGKLTHQLFLNEASLAGKLAHPHIVEIYDAVADEENAYIVMEYVEGGTLQQYTRSDNLLALGDTVEIIFKCVRALDFASRLGVIHRDIKPANILIKGDKEIKITDFGSAAMLMTTRTVVDGIGTPAYMAPEQHLNKPLNHQTDIYALGVVMFHLLTGRLPFQADNIAGLAHQILNSEPPSASEFRREISGALDAVVRRAIERDPAKRYQTWQQFATDLVAVAAGGLPQEKPGVTESEKFEALRTLDFFRVFSDVELWEVLQFAEWCGVAEGETIMREGELGEFFCVLASGSVRVVRDGNVLAVLGAGECFGEMAYLGDGGGTRTADVVAASELKMLMIPVAAIERAGNLTRFNFERAFLRALVARLKIANNKIAAT
jgi:eukaryotic-like serine/threonine-protein kinase